MESNKWVRISRSKFHDSMNRSVNRINKLQRHFFLEIQPSCAAQCVARDASLMLTRADFSYFLAIQTRWKDNDQYGHVNNAVYYEYFDTIINHWLINHGGLKIGGDLRALIVSSSCDFLASVQYPAVLEVALKVSKLGKSSLHWDIAIFSPHEKNDHTSKPSLLAAHGKMVHVFVKGSPPRPTEIPAAMREAIQREFIKS